MIPYYKAFYNFSRKEWQHTTFGEGALTKTVPIWFLVIDAYTSYKVLLGRHSLNLFRPVVSTLHIAMKSPSTAEDIITVHGDQKTARECYIASLELPLPKLTTNKVNNGRRRYQPEGEQWCVNGACRRNKCFPSTPRRSKFQDKDYHWWSMGESHWPNLENQSRLVHMDSNWQTRSRPSDSVASLSVFKGEKPVSQKKRKIREKRRQAAKAEAEKLLKAKFIKEAKYMTWIANLVLVKKASGKSCMCMDYTDLNKACLKDAYPMSSIDRLVNNCCQAQHFKLLVHLFKL